MRRERGRSIWLIALAAALAAAGCLNAPMRIPAGRLPPPAAATDASTSSVLGPLPIPPKDPGTKPGKVFELPPGLPGSDAPQVKVPQLPKDAPAPERQKAVQEAYPRLIRAGGALPVPDGTPLTLADLQQIALANSPVLVKAKTNLEVAYGQVVQAGLNPTRPWGTKRIRSRPDRGGR